MRARAGNKIINILTICALMACSVPTFAVDAMFPLNQRGVGGYSVYSDGAPTGFASDITNSPHPASSHLLPLEKGSFSSPSTNRRGVRGEVSIPTGFAVNAMFPLNQRGLGGYLVYSDGAPTGFAVDLTQTTLDSLAGQPIPNTDPVEYYPADLKSAYTLTPTDTVGTNTITKYIINDDNTLTPQYFDVNLRKTEYGEGANAIYYKWELDTDGNYKLVETADPNEAQITAKYDANNLQSRINNSADISATPIEGDFVSLYPNSNNGGAINNIGATAIIESITGVFIGNNTSARYSYGGAIYNTGVIDSINSNFIANYISAEWAYGAAISNRGTISYIKGDFINNDALGGGYYGGGLGGAINNDSGSIQSIVGSFIANTGRACDAYGGAIYNSYATISYIKGDFIGNYASAEYKSYGGAIYNYGNIGEITGDFINNYSRGDGSYGGGLGGAIYNIGSIQSIVGSFIGNYAIATATSGDPDAKGGAIFNENETSLIITNSSFINNYAKSETGTVQGGAIYTTADLNIVADNGTSEFTGNYTDFAGVIDDNAIYVDSSGAKLTLDAKNNGVITFNDNIKGASGYTLALTGDETGVINIHNTVSGAKMTASGIGKVDFVDNIAREYNLVSMTSDNAVKYAIDINLDTANLTADKFITTSDSTGTVTIDELNILSGDWDSLVAQGEGVIQILQTPTTSTIQLALGDSLNLPTPSLISQVDLGTTSTDIVKDVKWNDAFGATTTTKDIYGTVGLGTTTTTNDSIAVNITEVLTNTVTTSSGDTLQLWNQFDTTEEKSFNFDSAADVYTATADTGETKGTTLNINGVIDTDGNRSTIDFDGHSGLEIVDTTELNIKNVNLENSSALITNTNADSAINLTNVNIKNNAGGITSKGDINLTADGADVEISGNDGNAIYLDSIDKTLSINLKNGGTVTLKDDIDGITTFKTVIQGDNIDTSVYNMLGQINNADLSVGNLTFNTIDGVVNSYTPHSLTIAQDVKMLVDVDLANKSMDRFDAGTYGAHAGDLIVSGMNLVSDSKTPSTEILFAEYGLKDNIVNEVAEIGNGVDNAYQGTAYAPIYKYSVSYDNREDAGYFLFNRFSTGGNGGSPSNPSDAFNPSVLATPAAQQAGGQAVVTESVRFAFQHADTFTQLPMHVRMSTMDNKYAVLEGGTTYQKPYHMQNKGVWVKPFTSFESMDLKNGPKVDAVTYGTIVGFDSNFQDLGRGWYGVTSAYAGYNGSMIEYANIDTTMNGGLVGLTETLYKDKFFAALTATAGANTGSSNTMYGKEDFTSLVGGIGLKTGYNFEFQEGRYIIQPIMFMNYTFVNTFDYTSASGVRIDSDPMHAFQLNPSVRFIANLKNGWQPYASVGMVWNVLNSSKVKADDIILPKMSMKPYVEYGLGLQRSWADRFTAYGQAMVRNGGRNGVMLSAGMRWSLGEDEPLDAI